MAKYIRKPEPELRDPEVERDVSAPDYLSRIGALALKARIEAARKERGLQPIPLRIVGESRGPGLGVVFGLASDCVVAGRP